ncbi:MAG: transposase [bacterium]|nr:transposase [bacterium]
MYDSKTALQTRVQLEDFLGIFSPHFSVPLLKFIGQMLFGIQAAKSVLLTRIGHELREGTTPKKTEERLCRNLGTASLGDQIHKAVMREAARLVHRRTLIIVDPSDIQKPYAKKMDYLARTWDGSRGEKGEGLGYWGCMAIACENGGRRVVPLQFRVWSAKDPLYRSENEEIEKVVDSICAETKRRGIYVYDRGGDRIEFFLYFLRKGLDFIVRLIKTRRLVWKKHIMEVEQVARICHTPYEAWIEFNAHGEDEPTRISFGVIDVCLPEDAERPEVGGAKLRLVVVRGFGKTPMMLLTTLALEDTRDAVWEVVQGYLTRWRVEETIRFVKQSYHVEEVRNLMFARVRNVAALVLAVTYFVTVRLGLYQKRAVLRQHITNVARRIFGTPEFHYYAIADGVRDLFMRHARWNPAISRKKERPNPQMEFDFDYSSA